MAKQPSKSELDKINKRLKKAVPDGWPYAKLDVRERRKGWVFVVRYSVNRIPTLTTIQTHDLSAALAERDAVQQVLNEKKEADLNAPKVHRGGIGNTLREVADEWLAHRKATKKAGTAKNDALAIDSLFEVIEPGIMARDFTARHAVKWLTHLATAPGKKVASRPISPRTANKRLRHLKVFGSYMVAMQVTSKNPFTGVQKLAEPDLDPKLVTNQQIEAMFQDCAGDLTLDKSDTNLLTLLWFTGCRISEALELKWSHVSFAEGFLTVTGKGSRKRAIPLTVKVQAALLSQHELNLSSVYVFPRHRAEGWSSEEPAVFDSIRTRWEKRFKKAGVPGLHFHWLRHTRATLLANSGANLDTVGTILGHSQVSTTQGYLHPDLEALRRAMESELPG